MSQKFFEKFGEKTILPNQEKVLNVLQQLKNVTFNKLTTHCLATIINLENKIVLEHDPEKKERLKTILIKNYQQMTSLPNSLKAELFLLKLLNDSHFTKPNPDPRATIPCAFLNYYSTTQFSYGRATSSIRLIRDGLHPDLFHLHQDTKTTLPSTFMTPGEACYSTKTLCSFRLTEDDHQILQLVCSGEKNSLNKYLDKSTVDFIDALFPSFFHKEAEVTSVCSYIS